MNTPTMEFALAENQAQKLTDWANEPTMQNLKGDLDMAKPTQQSQMIRIAGWNDLTAVRGKAKAPKVKGRSEVQPKLIRRQAEWRYSALTEPFLGTNKLFSVSPVTFEDELGAKQNELVLNWQFRTKLNKVRFIDNYVRSVVDEGTCIVRVGWKRATVQVKETVPVYAHYPIEQEEQLEMLKQALELSAANPRQYNEQVDPAIKAAVDYYNESGQPTVAVQSGEQQVSVEKILENYPTVDVKNPGNIFIDPTCQGDIRKALFIVESMETNKADLLKEGKRYKNLDRVNWEGNTPMTQPDHETSTPMDVQFKDSIRKKVVAYEYWGYYDIAGDGVLVPIVATWIGDTIIRLELNPYPDEGLPYVLVPYLPVKRELYGEPDAELLEDNQKILGAVTRGMIDLLGRSANGQLGFGKGMLDPLNRRRYENGQDYEFNPNLSPANGLIEHKFPELPQSAFAMLGLQNQEAESLTGVKSFGGGLSGEAYGEVAAGIRGVLDAASKREMAILRRLAKGMEEIGSKISAMNSVFMSEEEVIRVTNNEFVTVNREDLKGNFDFVVDISTAEVDDAKSKDLAFMFQTLGPTVDTGISMMILSEIAELKRMPALANKLKNFKPEPDPIQQELAQLEVELKKVEIAKIQSEIDLNAAKAEEARANKDMTDLDYVEQETGTKHARDMQKQGGQARGNQNLEITKAIGKSRKEGESKPDIAAMLGYNELSDTLQAQENQG